MDEDMTHAGLIYAYPHYVGQVQSIDRLNVRHKTHLKKHFDWPEPEAVEIVTGVDHRDLLFNLAFQETIWMFKLHTYRPIFSGGLNLALPFAWDRARAGHLGGLIGGKRTKQLHPEEQREWCRRASKAANGNGGKRTKQLHPEEQREWCRRASKAANGNGGKRTKQLHPEEQRIWCKKASSIGLHHRWHTNRNVISPSCDLCAEVV
jgi:hypothetical protein